MRVFVRTRLWLKQPLRRRERRMIYGPRRPSIETAAIIAAWSGDGNGDSGGVSSVDASSGRSGFLWGDRRKTRAKAVRALARSRPQVSKSRPGAPPVTVVRAVVVPHSFRIRRGMNGAPGGKAGTKNDSCFRTNLNPHLSAKCADRYGAPAKSQWRIHLPEVRRMIYLGLQPTRELAEQHEERAGAAGDA
jgi:hypothetical protein